MSTRSPAAVAMSRALLADPDKSKDIRVGDAVIPFGWDNHGSEGWRLPGRKITRDIADAYRAAYIIDREMQR